MGCRRVTDKAGAHLKRNGALSVQYTKLPRTDPCPSVEKARKPTFRKPLSRRMFTDCAQPGHMRAVQSHQKQALPILSGYLQKQQKA